MDAYHKTQRKLKLYILLLSSFTSLFIATEVAKARCHQNENLHFSYLQKKNNV